MFQLFNQLELFRNFNIIEHATSVSPNSEFRAVMEEINNNIAPTAKTTPPSKPAGKVPAASPKPVAKSPPLSKPAGRARSPPPLKPAGRAPKAVINKQHFNASVNCSNITNKNMCLPANNCIWNTTLSQCLNADVCSTFNGNMNKCNKNPSCSFITNNNMCKPYSITQCASLSVSDCNINSKCFNCTNTKTCMIKSDPNKGLCSWIGYKNAYDKFSDTMNATAASADNTYADADTELAPATIPTVEAEIIKTVAPTSVIIKPAAK